MKLEEVIIDKDTDVSFVVSNFPIHWSLNRVSGLMYCIDRAKETGVSFRLSLDMNHTYKLEVIRGENEEESKNNRQILKETEKILGPEEDL